MKVVCEVSGVQYGIAGASDMNEMARLLAVIFSGYDPPAVAMGLTPAEFESFVQFFCPTAAEEELTIIARSATTGEMIGALLADDGVSDAPEGFDQISEKFLPIFGILGQLDQEFRNDRRMNKGEYLHLFLLGVAKESMGQKVAQRLVAQCLANGAGKGYQFAITEATNSISQHIFRKLGFSDRVSRSYQQYRYKGKAVFSTIEGHLGPILMERVI